jgi:lipid-A-disaccharide synthase-like uncharacterized protein
MSGFEKVVSVTKWSIQTLLMGLVGVCVIFGGAFLIDFLVELKNQYVLPSLIIGISIIVAAVIVSGRSR